MRNAYAFFIAFLAALALALSVSARAATAKGGDKGWLLQGIVRDSLTLAPLPGASVTIDGARQGTVADVDGVFKVTVPTGAKSATVTYLGYEKKTVALPTGAIRLLDIHLAPKGVTLDEVTVRRKKEKYSKRNNPAVDFVGRIRRHADDTDPRRNDNYSYRRYERITLGLNDFAERDENSWMFRKFPFLWEHVDTSEVSGKPILNFSLKEQTAEVMYRRKPRSQRTRITGVKSDGLDEIVDPESIQRFLNDVMGEIDLYQNDITLLQNRFVSPLGKIGPDFYKYYLTDTIEVDGERCIVLSFVPRNSATFGFVGQIYVPENDSTMFIKRVTMRVPHSINLNFITQLYIAQEYQRAPDGSRLLMSDDMTLEATVIPGTQGLYARRNAVYADHSFAPPTPEQEALFSQLAPTTTDDQAHNRDDDFWQQQRLSQLRQAEEGVPDMMRRLREVPIFYWGEKIVNVLFNGYIPTALQADKSKFDIGPVNTMISGNSLEGVRLRLGGMTTAQLSPHWFARGYAAYGTRDHRWKYNAEVEYSFRAKRRHAREFPVHSLLLQHKYDIDRPGQHYLFTNPDNFVLVLKRREDRQMTYLRQTRLRYMLELENNFSVQAEVFHHIQYATQWMPFVTVDGRNIAHFAESGLKVELRYAPGEKFFQTRSHRLPISQDAPVLTLSHTVAPGGAFGNRYTLNRTELSVQKRFWFSAFGYLDAMVKGGHVWSRTPYPALLAANANLSYTIQPESFALLNPMEFVNDSQAEWHLTYWANGAILNYVPLVKRLKLREVFAFRGFMGHLSPKNRPSADNGLPAFPAEIGAEPMRVMRPYMEASVGLDNILRCLRVDYVWRLAYRHAPGVDQRGGVRVALHLTF